MSATVEVLIGWAIGFPIGVGLFAFCYSRGWLPGL